MTPLSDGRTRAMTVDSPSQLWQAVRFCDRVPICKENDVDRRKLDHVVDVMGLNRLSLYDCMYGVLVYQL